VRGRRGAPVSPAFIADLERDRRVGSQELLAAVEAALDLEPDYLNAMAGRLPRPLNPQQWTKVRSAIRKALPVSRKAEAARLPPPTRPRTKGK
jgi:transcriptional regulator with XRE-family HTH domain